MSGTLQIDFHGGLFLLQQFTDALCIREPAAIQHLVQQQEKLRQFLPEHLGLDAEFRQIGVRLTIARISGQLIRNTSGIKIL